MKENIMYVPTIVLVVIEVAAAVFLVCSWFKAKREARDG